MNHLIFVKFREISCKRHFGPIHKGGVASIFAVSVLKLKRRLEWQTNWRQEKLEKITLLLPHLPDLSLFNHILSSIKCHFKDDCLSGLVITASNPKQFKFKVDLAAEFSFKIILQL